MISTQGWVFNMGEPVECNHQSKSLRLFEKLTSPPYNKYEIQAIAKVGQYDGELQLDVLNPSNFNRTRI